MDLKAILDYGHGLGMSEKQVKSIEEQEMLAKVAEVQTVKEEKLKFENTMCYRCGEN